jgi:hypothetical protein
LPALFGKKKKEDDSCTPGQTGTLRRGSGSGWREVTTVKTEPWEDEGKHSPWKKKWRYAFRLFRTSSLKEGAV